MGAALSCCHGTGGTCLGCVAPRHHYIRCPCSDLTIRLQILTRLVRESFVRLACDLISGCTFVSYWAIRSRRALKNDVDPPVAKLYRRELIRTIE